MKPPKSRRFLTAACLLVLGGAVGSGIALAGTGADSGSGDRGAPGAGDAGQRQMMASHGRATATGPANSEEMRAMHRSMAPERMRRLHRRAMRDREMRRMHRRAMRDPEMRSMHRQMMGGGQMDEMHRQMMEEV